MTTLLGMVSPDYAVRVKFVYKVLDMRHPLPSRYREGSLLSNLPLVVGKVLDA